MSSPVKQLLERVEVEPEARPFHYADGKLQCDGFDLPELATEFGTPLYVYSALQILSRYDLFARSFAPFPHVICYAVKANSSLAILQMLGRHGAGFDIVSGGELERVRRASPNALERVVFSGVGKQAWEIDAALRANILLFNVESEAEIDLLAARAAGPGGSCPIRAAGQSRCLREYASVHLYWSARAQIWNRHRQSS